MQQTTALATSDLRAFVLEVHHRLSKEYGSKIRYFHDLDPLSELVSAMLSHRTRNSQSGLAFRNLKDRFGTWEAVMQADTKEVEAAVSPCTWPEQKAPRIQLVLRLIHEKLGNLSLDHLGSWEVSAARQWLETLPGVGPKTSAAVISFSNLRGKALPVDSHHFRVVVRLGIIEAKLGEGKAHHVLESLLPEDFTAQDVYDHHQVVMKHGKNVCFYKDPDCRNCVLLDLCPTGKSRQLAVGS